MTNQFDAKAAQWDHEQRRVVLAQAIADAIAKAVPLNPSKTALEFGCGTGLVTACLAPKLASVTAVDTSAGMLDVLSQKIESAPLPNVTPLWVDLTQNHPLEGTFDLIFSSMTFHHIKDYKSLLKLFSTLLNPQGFIAIADLDAEDGSFHGPETHIEHTGFDRTEFKTALQALGLNRITDTIAFTISREKDGLQRQYPVFLITAQKA